MTLAALGARVTKRPVKLVLSRREMYYGVGYRPHTVQRVALGASRDGRLSAIVHEGYQETSTYEEFSEALINATRFLYSCPNVSTRHRLAPMNVHTPTYMRAPGEVSGTFALETAMDELAVALGIDPVELRLRNEPQVDESRKLPFSSRSTRECYRQAAERFGWRRRNAKPRSMRDGRWLVGWGMASCNLSNEPCACVGRGAAAARRHRASDECSERHGTGHLDIDDTGRGRGARIADRASAVHAGRYTPAPSAGTRRLDDDGERRQRRAGRVPNGARGGACA